MKSMILYSFLIQEVTEYVLGVRIQGYNHEQDIFPHSVVSGKNRQYVMC